MIEVDKSKNNILDSEGNYIEFEVPYSKIYHKRCFLTNEIPEEELDDLTIDDLANKDIGVELLETFLQYRLDNTTEPMLFTSEYRNSVLLPAEKEDFLDESDWHVMSIKIVHGENEQYQLWLVNSHAEEWGGYGALDKALVVTSNLFPDEYSL